MRINLRKSRANQVSYGSPKISKKQSTTMSVKKTKNTFFYNFKEKFKYIASVLSLALMMLPVFAGESVELKKGTGVTPVGADKYGTMTIKNNAGSLTEAIGGITGIVAGTVQSIGLITMILSIAYYIMAHKDENADAQNKAKIGIVVGFTLFIIRTIFKTFEFIS